ncbi:hypothetical protein [Abyssogena phaseoliformis symbiont]|uniref:hypothetical protein n=1 Tax=Abyssogena phaseoliformis symbiont TaxID=596095 RepID=UPI001CECFF3E|nr:hypothetical protein [Abyssogena phaseoliformis symbiont]MBW5288810.1 hypothetical protein [Candidatus Ruthia sp. Apha_13_S6]
MLSNTLAVLNGSSLSLKALPIRQLSFEQILTRQLEKGNLSAWVIRWQHDLKYSHLLMIALHLSKC